jgi:lysophospholipase L1-like esterase
MGSPTPRRLVLLGDSILDNGSYTSPAPDTTAHVRKRIGAGWTVECGARDGATMRQVAAQLAALPPGRPAVVVLSVGGNDLLENSQALPLTTAPVAEIFSAILDLMEDLGARYAGVLEALRPRTDRLIVCTIYEVPLSDPALALLARVALAVFNDRVQRAAVRHGAEVLELRDVCTRTEDFALEIEPSAEGARKIATAIVDAVNG